MKSQERQLESPRQTRNRHQLIKSNNVDPIPVYEMIRTRQSCPKRHTPTIVQLLHRMNSWIVSAPVYFQLYQSLLYPLHVPTQSVEPQNQADIQQKPEDTKRQDGAKFHPQAFILTKEDLLECGYEVIKRVWTEQEDKSLVFLKEQRGLDWEQISKTISGRNPKMCYSRYKRLVYSTKNLWKEKQDQKLRRLVQEHGEKWEIISTNFKRRNARQLKERYVNYLREDLDNREWTLEEDLELIQFLKSHGRNWGLAEQTFKGRSLNQIKNRYYGRLKKLNDKKVASQAL